MKRVRGARGALALVAALAGALIAGVALGAPTTTTAAGACAPAGEASNTMSRMPEAPRDLPMILNRLQEDVAYLKNRSPFYSTGMHPNGQGGIDSDNFVAGVSGYQFKDDGDAEFNQLTLRGGIIGNDALASPVVPGVVNASSTGITVGTGSFGVVASQNATVPTGCTRLLAHATGMVYAVNPNTTGGTNGAGGDVMAALCAVGSTSGLTAGVSISGGNGQTSVSCSVAVLLEGLTPGSTVTFATKAQAVLQSFGSNATNQANISASLIWLR